MTTIAQRLREIAGRLSAMSFIHDRDASIALEAIAAELEAAPAVDAVPVVPDCWAILTPNGSKLVSPDEAKGRKDAYPLYTNAAFASIAADLIDAKARVAELEARQVPEGWVAVPQEPTSAMLFASEISDTEYYFSDLDCAHGFLAGCYRAMIAAAPSKPEGGE